MKDEEKKRKRKKREKKEKEKEKTVRRKKNDRGWRKRMQEG